MIHFHKWRDWEHVGDIDYYIDGHFHKTKRMWQATCKICGKPSRRKSR